MLGVSFDLRARPADVDVDCPRVADPVETPDSIEELAPGEGASRMCREHGQELVLLGPKVVAKPSRRSSTDRSARVLARSSSRMARPASSSGSIDCATVGVGDHRNLQRRI